jgi:hypothetical protein
MHRISSSSPAVRALFVVGLAALVAGTFILGPADAAKRKRFLTVKKGDARYVNVGEKAGDADTLDGQDSSAFVKVGDTVMGRFSCPGTVFFPEATFGGYGMGGSGRRTSGAAQAFRCIADLPHGATVVELAATFYDNTASDQNCTLIRTDLAPPITDEATLATVATTGTPTDIRLTDTTIDQATVDTENHGYSIRCGLPSSSDGLYGATVAYEVPAP